MKRLAALLSFAFVTLGASAQAQPSAAPIRIGVLNDQSGPYSAQTGPGAVIAARLAIEDFGPTVLGRAIEIQVGDHQNKPDIGASLARRWFDIDGVSVIVDVPTSSVALAVQEVARRAERIVLYSGSGAAELTGTACAPLSMQWTYDTYALAAGTGSAMTKAGGDTWFLLTVDYSFGVTMARDLTAVVTSLGGKVVGTARHPLGAPDFASQLLMAQASGAKVVGLLNAGQDTANAIKQAAEFGLVAKGQRLAGMVVTVVDIKGLGLQAAQGLQFTESFYWDQNEATRAWSRRFFDKHGKMPTMMQAGVYSATLHWLRAVKAANTLDAAPVAAAMRRAPIDDMMTKGARIRADGRVMRDFYLFEAKKPAESSGPWDLYKLVRTIPADDAARPVAQSTCPLLK